jgi:hypothetical protein
MIADEIIQEVCEGLNLSSDEAKSRVARRLNARYRRVTSSIGLDTTRRAVVSKAATIGVSTITFTGVEKLLTVYTVNGTVNTLLEQITPDDMLSETVVSDNTPTKYAIYRVYPTSIDVKINSVPSGSGFTLYAEGETTQTTLAGSAQPQFPESFHDILVFGVMADEYRKMEKIQLAQAAEQDYEHRLSDLRMWIAKTSWMDVYQGKNQSAKWWQQGTL